MAAGAVIVFSPFRNPLILQFAPGDGNWHKATGFPPTPPAESGAFLVTTITSALGDGGGAWIQMNVGGSAPSDTSKAWPLHGGGQVLMLGGGVNDLWFQLKTGTDIFVLMAER